MPAGFPKNNVRFEPVREVDAEFSAKLRGDVRKIPHLGTPKVVGMVAASARALGRTIAQVARRAVHPLRTQNREPDVDRQQRADDREHGSFMPTEDRRPRRGLKR